MRRVLPGIEKNYTRFLLPLTSQHILLGIYDMIRSSLQKIHENDLNNKDKVKSKLQVKYKMTSLDISM